MEAIDRGLLSLLILMCAGFVTALAVLVYALAEEIGFRRKKRKEKDESGRH